MKRGIVLELRRLLEEQHYSERQAAITLGISRNTVRRIREGDIDLLCQITRNDHSRLDPFATEIAAWLSQGIKSKTVRNLLEEWYALVMGNAQVSDYCARLKQSLGLNPPCPVRFHFVSRQLVFQHIWSDKDIEAKDWADVCEIYPRVLEMDEMVAKFRESLHERDAEKLSIWMSRYEYSSFTHIGSFINGLKRDWEAVRNGFTYTYNSGFVEGTVNKLKMKKRMMYGRAGYPLLRAKILVPWQQQRLDSSVSS